MTVQKVKPQCTQLTSKNSSSISKKI